MDSLGELEQKSLKEIWRRGESSVGDVCIAFGDTYAYTTLMTTLDRVSRCQKYDLAPKFLLTNGQKANIVWLLLN